MLEEREDPATGAPNDLESLWLPFTPNRQFKAHPRIVVSAKGMHYRSHDGREILDSSAGLWCANLGHCHPKVVAAVQKGIATLDFAPTFQFGHNKVFELASRVAAEMPDDLNRVFFCNSGSEAVDSALKIALAYHLARGEGQRTRLIGRERAYHGVGFGGISVGGMVPTGAPTGRCCRASTICATPSIWSTTRSRAASPSGARISPTTWSGFARCTTPRPSPR